MHRFSGALLVTAVLVSTWAGASLAADDGEPLGWYFDAELAMVMTGGNSESNTLGFGGKLRRLWTKSELTFTGGATQSESSLITRTAQGSITDFEVMEDKETTKTAELYFARGWYEYKFSPKFFAFSGVDWMSNKFAGIDSRFLIALGAGNTWKNTDKFKFKTHYSMTYTFEEDVVENPFVKTEFPGFRLGYGLEAQLSSSTKFESNLIADWNIDEMDDVRVDFYNALPVSISETLQLMPALRLLWRNEPALTLVPLVDGGGVPTGDTVPAQLKKTDTIFTLALVVKLGPKAKD
jgi:putative salt-induced outer membrane protein YdiY